MIYLRAFIVCGIGCGVAQIIMDNTKLTPGHITSLFTVLGAFLSFLGLYDKLIDYSGTGATVLISNFGHALYSSGLNGFTENGYLGMIQQLLCKSSVAIVSAVVFAAIFSFLFKPKS